MRFSDSNIVRDIFLYEWTSLDEALAYFKQLPYNNLPVVGENNLFVGTITLKSIAFNQSTSNVALVKFS